MNVWTNYTLDCGQVIIYVVEDALGYGVIPPIVQDWWTRINVYNQKYGNPFYGFISSVQELFVDGASSSEVLRFAGYTVQQLSYFWIKEIFWPNLWSDLQEALDPNVFDEDWESKNGKLVPSPGTSPEIDPTFDPDFSTALI